MTESQKRLKRRSEEDAAFSRMLLCLLGAVIAEVVVLLVKRFYVDAVSLTVAKALLAFFSVYQYIGIALAVAGVVWCVLFCRKGKRLGLPLLCTVIVASLWIITLFAYYLHNTGVQFLMILPAVAAVLILIYFLYQRAFFANAILTGGGMAVLWLLRKYHMSRFAPRMLCVAVGVILLGLAALLAWKLSKTGGKLGKVRLMPENSNYPLTWITCAVTAIAMILGLILGGTAAYYLLFVLIGWLFCQAVYFTVKLM